MVIGGIIYLYLILLPFVGVVQFIGMLQRSSKLGDRTDLFASDLRWYKSIVFKYLGIIIFFGFLLYNLPNQSETEILSTIYIGFLTLIPGFMAAYYWNLIWHEEDRSLMHKNDDYD